MYEKKISVKDLIDEMRKELREEQDSGDLDIGVKPYFEPPSKKPFEKKNKLKAKKPTPKKKLKPSKKLKPKKKPSEKVKKKKRR